MAQPPQPSAPQPPRPLSRFEVVSETVLYKRYLTLFDRRVRLSAAGGGSVRSVDGNGSGNAPAAAAGDDVRELSFDVIGHPQAGEEMEGWRQGLRRSLMEQTKRWSPL